MRARKLGAAEMILTDAARLQAEADLFDQHRLRITLGAHGPHLGTAGEHFLDLAEPRLDLGDILARILIHLPTHWRQITGKTGRTSVRARAWREVENLVGAA